MKNSTLVSILINNYNYDKFLMKAIDSALDQTYDNIEVIVVDDGSTDNSQAIINSYGNKIIPILKENGGQASAFNLGFAKSQGEIIFFLDSDDFFIPEKVSTVVDIFSIHQEIDWLFHPLKYVGHISDLKPNNYASKASGIYDLRKYLAQGKLGNRLPIGIATSGMCIKRNILQQILPMPDIIKITSDDYIKHSALGLSKGYILLEELAIQRIHANNAYTLRADKQSLEAEVLILTAYYLKKDFPFLSKFADNIFALGLGIYQNLKPKPSEYLHFIETYISSLTWWKKFEVNMRAMYYRFKY